MRIEQNLTNTNYNPRGTNPSWIVIHNTANGTSAEGIAYNNTQFFKNVYREASAHYFIDDGDIIWQCVKDTDTAWHVGEASSRNGCTNYNSIGIEVCEPANGRFTDKEISTLTELVQYLMDKYDIDYDHVTTHHLTTGKNCPWYYVFEERWDYLKNIITGGVEVISNDDIKKIAQAVWEYIYHKSLPDEDKILGNDMDSNRYNVENMTYLEAKRAKDYAKRAVDILEGRD